MERFKYNYHFRIISFALCWVFSLLSLSAKEDLQSWNPVQFNYNIDDTWSVSMQSELRLGGGINEYTQQVLKPGVHYRIDDVWTVSLGYKYIIKNHDGDEQDLWQELTYHWDLGKLKGAHQFRMEERFLDDVGGVIPRARFLSHFSYPMAETDWHYVGSGAIRFNLDDKGEGPVEGFEQTRFFAGLSHPIGERSKVEFGYLWRYEQEREGPSVSDHAIHIMWVFNFGHERVPKPKPAKHYR
ncbi:DUF2490 domain-containing protein [Lentisphaera profundi]|uniref:DUF2490 domain-containing protein n=1 Tax=Lentisphaera profundi TaxID=1658616 RepID=A0ABY7VZ62_9BACT|nr:DUF2490 domain-containing protein [Lentisphaera profundi]WDE99079.1 DUF2490 domain-containing protein [Lentisphaera profundi]